MHLAKRCAAIFAALFFFGTINDVAAQDVALTSRDGSIEIEGDLLSFDGEFYRVDTVYGALTLDSQGVICAGPGCPDLGAYVADIRISGARTMGDVLLPALVEAYAASRDLRLRRLVTDDADFRYDLLDRTTDRPVARFHFRVNATDEGFADLVAEEADLAMALREITPPEIARAQEASLGDLSSPRRARIVALDGLVPIVGRGSPLASIQFAQLQGVLSGEITDWAVLGAEPGPIHLHMREAGSGINFNLQALIHPDPPSQGSRITRHTSNASLADAVAADPLAFAVTAFSEVGNATALDLIGPCGRRVAATNLTLKAEDYPLATPLFLYTPARRLPLFAREFLAWLTTPSAQLVVRRTGFVNLSPASIPLSDQGERLSYAVSQAGEEVSLGDLQEMITALDGAERLTTTFRFRGGSTELDAQSRTNILLLAREIEAGIHDGHSLVFVGFSDGRGDAATNRRLSRDRARSVFAAMKETAKTADWSRLETQILGFGEALPMGCDEVTWGRQMNRRVEVWRR